MPLRETSCLLCCWNIMYCFSCSPPTNIPQSQDLMISDCDLKPFVCSWVYMSELRRFKCNNFTQTSQSLHQTNVNLYFTWPQLSSQVLWSSYSPYAAPTASCKVALIIMASPCNVRHCEHEKVRLMSRCFALTSEGSMIAVIRQLGEMVAQKKGILSGPEIGSRNARTHIQSCPRHM